jgi:site-specific DNA-methyltransferase (adenine-specific)
LLGQEKLGFPTQKPLELCTQVIRLTTKPGDWVLDPFAGSGTIPVAARETGRHFYACEADKEVYEQFKDRIIVS